MQGEMKWLHDVSPYEGHDVAAHPGDMQGWGAADPIFGQVIQSIRPRLIIEVGTWKGASAILMGKIARDLGIPIQILCIDTWLGSPEHMHPYWRQSLRLRNGYPQLYYTFLTNVIENQLTEVIFPFPATSENAAQILLEKSIRPDLVYIDATHEYEAVLRDLRAFWPLLNDTGVLLGDDYLDWPGVTRAADDFASELKLPIAGRRGKFVISKKKSVLAEITGAEPTLRMGRGAAHEQRACPLDGALQGVLVSELGQRKDGVPWGNRSLTDLANRFGSDRGAVTGVGGPPRRYTYLYDVLFAPFRTRPITLLELGVAFPAHELPGSDEQRAMPPSVQMWLEYFINSQIIGFGKSHFSYIRHPRFMYISGDTGSERDLRRLAAAAFAFDIVIDGGSHSSYQQQMTLKHLFPKLAPNGLYIIEDVDKSLQKRQSSLWTPETVELLVAYYEQGRYIDNPVLSADTMLEFKRVSGGFTFFPPLDGAGGPTNLIVLRKCDIDSDTADRELATPDEIGIAGQTDYRSPASGSASLHSEGRQTTTWCQYHLVSHHDTILYVDVASEQLRHAPLGIAPLNLVLELSGPRGRLLMTGASPSEVRQVSFEQSTGGARMQTGRADLEFHVETFPDDSIGIRAGGKYVGADQSGIVRNNIDWCREWERYRLVRADTLDRFALLKRYSWISHRDRRIITLADQPIDFGREERTEASALAATLASHALDFRREIVFGPARMRLVGKDPSILVDTSDYRDGASPSRVHIADGPGVINNFSRFKPLIFYCVYGDEPHYECLHLSLISLAEYGCFDGALGIACDRPANELVKYVPATFHHRLILSEASEEHGSFNRYYLDHGLYDAYQPVLYCDVGVVFDASITDLLIDILRCRQVCCAPDEGIPSDLADSPRRLWDEGKADSFGWNFLASDPELGGANVPLGNSGVVGFASTAQIREVNALVRMLAAKQGSDGSGDQPILNYVLRKTGLGNLQALGRYFRLARGPEDVPPAERRGLTLFDVGSATTGVSAKASLMRSYLDALRRHEEDREGERSDVELNLSIPGQMDAIELDCLARLARRVAPNGCIVEVGALFGRSSWTLARNTHASVTVYCLDPWVRESWMAPLEERAGHHLSFKSFKHYVSGILNIIPLRGYSPREFVGWQRAIDLLFLGTALTNPGLHFDLTFWGRLVRPGGWICGHAYSDEFPDVKTEVDQLTAGLGTRVEVGGTLWSIRVPEAETRGMLGAIA